jgi:Flp pilus assembly protein TadD
VRLHRHKLAALCLAAVAVALYGPTLDHGFVFDDLWNIQENEAIRLERLDRESLARASRGARGMGNRPVSNLSFALNYYVARQDPGPRAYRWASLLIHGGSAALVYGILALTLGAARGCRSRPGEPRPAAAGAARRPLLLPLMATLLWLVHPIHTQSVSYLHQRMTSLAALFFLGSLFAYILGRRADSPRRRGAAFAAAVVCGALALGSKETALVLPIVILLYEWTFFQELRLSWLRERRRIWVLGSLLLACIALLYLREGWSWFEWMYGQLPISPAQRLLTQSRVVVFGLSLLAFPHPSRLNVDHDLAPSASLFEPPTTLLSLGLLAGLLALTLWCAHRRWRFAFFGVVWLFATQLVESSVLPVEMVAEHRLYLPSVGALFLLLEPVSRWRRPAPRWAAIAAASIALLLGSWTLERNQVWKDGASLWADAVAKSPLKVRPRNNLALALTARGETARAKAQLRQALRLQPTHPEASFNLGRLLLAEGDVEEAIVHLLAAVRGKEDLFDAQYALGLALLRAGHPAAAERRLVRALNLRPKSPDAHYELANTLRLQGRVEEAEVHYLFALLESAVHVRRLYQLADRLAEQGEGEQAARLYETILRVRPDDAIVHSRLGLALARLGQLDKARRHGEKAIELDPQLTSAQRLLEALDGIPAGGTAATPDPAGGEKSRRR